MNLPYGNTGVSLPSGRCRLHETFQVSKAKEAIAKEVAMAKKEKLFCGNAGLHLCNLNLFVKLCSLIILCT